MIAALVLAATVQFDHLWIVVSRDAPERAVLEKAGFRIAPTGMLKSKACLRSVAVTPGQSS